MSRKKRTHYRTSSKAKKKSALESFKQNLKYKMANWAVTHLQKYQQIKEKMKEKGYYESAENFLDRFKLDR
jgi:hypothetical protein